jgi:hypothetical protein
MHLWSLSILSILLLTSCAITDQDSYEPAYLILGEASIATKPSQGASCSSIKDAWVVVNGQLLGVFPLPAKVPIITTGKPVEIQINAGVKENADRNISVEYPFFKPISKTLDLQPNKSFTIDTKFEYKENVIFDFIEDFESNTTLLSEDIDKNTNTKIAISSKDKSKGLHSGLILLDKTNKDAEVSTSIFYTNTNKGNIYVEFDYKNQENIAVGAEVVRSGSIITEYKVLLTKSTEWKRAYINLSDKIAVPQVSGYRLLIGSSYENIGNNPSEIYIDNVKLIHF